MDDTAFSFNNDNNAQMQDSILTGTTSMSFDQDNQQPAKIKVIGVGGGGGNAVNHMYRQGIKGVDFIVCNTDAKALSASPVPNKIELGKLGAGNVPERARKLALEHKDEIREIISNDTQMLFITAGMGGGTGTGAAPIIAEIAKSIELADDMVPRILVVAIVTMPFTFEGKRRREQAIQGIEELRKHVDAILIINNDKLRDICGNVPFSVAFSQADDVLLTAAKGIAEIITVSGYVNIDFRDVNTVMEKSGTALMGAGEGRGENRAMQAIEAATTSVLLNDNDIRGAKNILLYFSYSPNHQITMDEIGEVTDYLTDLIGDNDANIIWGNADDDSLDDQLRITLIATGFEQRPGTKVIDLGAEMKRKEEEAKRKMQEEEAKRKELEEQAKAAEAQNLQTAEANDDSGMRIIHRQTEATVNTAAANQVTNPSPAPAPQISDNPFDKMVTNQVGDKRIVTLDLTAEERKEVVDNKPAEKPATGNSHLDDIRVINRNIVEQSRQAHQPATEPVLNIHETEAFGPATNINQPTQSTTQNAEPEKPFRSGAEKQVANAFQPKEEMSDQQLKLKAERIRRINDLLHNNPDGPCKVERMTIEELTGETILHENYSGSNDALSRTFRNDGSIAYGFNCLNDLPD